MNTFSDDYSNRPPSREEDGDRAGSRQRNDSETGVWADGKSRDMWNNSPHLSPAVTDRENYNNMWNEHMMMKQEVRQQEAAE